MMQSRQAGKRRRWTSRVVICAALGAVLQYVVAVAFSLRASPGEFSGAWLLKTLPPVRGSDNHLALNRYHSFGREMLHVRFSYSTLYELHSRLATGAKPSWTNGYWFRLTTGETLRFDSEPPAQRLPSPAPPWSHLATLCEDSEYDYYPVAGGVDCIEGGFGWPMRSASYFAEFPPPSNCLVREGLLVAGVGGDVVLPRVIPLRIIWTGALANTAVYGATLFLILFFAFDARTTCRRRRGRCIACGYDLRGANHAVCPECGEAR